MPTTLDFDGSSNGAANWMLSGQQALEVKSFASDEEGKNVCAYGVFFGTHTGQGGPCRPTGKRVKADYVYVMGFEGDTIRHMTKIWHAGLAGKQLGWT